MRLTALFLALALPAMADPAAEIVILGEVHDNPDAHLGQAAALRDIRPTAVVFEMLTAEEAARADADRSQIAAAWEASGWRDFLIYTPIFEALGEARIVGATAPRAMVHSVYTEGAAARLVRMRRALVSTRLCPRNSKRSVCSSNSRRIARPCRWR